MYQQQQRVIFQRLHHLNSVFHLNPCLLSPQPNRWSEPAAGLLGRIPLLDIWHTKPARRGDCAVIWRASSPGVFEDRSQTAFRCHPRWRRTHLSKGLESSVHTSEDKLRCQSAKECRSWNTKKAPVQRRMLTVLLIDAISEFKAGVSRAVSHTWGVSKCLLQRPSPYGYSNFASAIVFSPNLASLSPCAAVPRTWGGRGTHVGRAQCLALSITHKSQICIREKEQRQNCATNTICV